MLAPCIIPRLILNRTNTNHFMFREMVLKLYYFSLLTFQTKSITYELVGYFLYITIEVMQYTCL